MEKLIIIGSGPAGHTAAIYAARAKLEPLLFEGFMAGGVAAGGQLTTTTEIENFPGFPDPITGTELMEKMRAQSEKHGTRIVTKTVDRLDLSRKPYWVYSGEDILETKALIIAVGATALRMHVPGEELYWQKGISACAVCDGALPVFRNKPLAVIGGGDTACEEAGYLSNFASKVFLIHRRNELRASKVMRDKVLKNPKITVIWDTVMEDVSGDGKVLTGLRLRNIKTNTVSELTVTGLFYAIGHRPNTEFCKSWLVLDDAGYIVTEAGTCKTSVPGVFAAGDVRDKVYRQAITSAGTGCMAALEAEKFLSEEGVI